MTSIPFKTEPLGSAQRSSPTTVTQRSSIQGCPVVANFQSQKPTLDTIATESNHFSITAVASKLCEGKSTADRVQTMEGASAHAHIYLEGVKDILKRYEKDIPSTKIRIAEIEKAFARHKPCQVMVGFLGTSGAGKSSLINEILGEKILPHSEEQASTAVAVEISYHSLDDPASQYRASIEGISTTEFREELEQLYEDKLLWEEGPDGEDGEDDEEDLEVLQRIEVTMSKISCLIPHIQTIRDLENTSIDDILASEVCQSMLDRVTVWKCHDAVLFARYIKGYIDTSMSQDGEIAEFSVWPLVKVVKLQLRSNILKNGIVLVDLPGSHDTSAARVKVADEYQKKLAVTCVVAPTTRAASDKIAHDLLSNDKRRTMQLDGKYNSDSLYFVITKIDDLIDVSSYIRDHPNLRKSLSEEVSERDKLKQEIKKLRGDISKGRAANVKKNIPALQSLRNRIKDIEPQVEEIWNSLTKYYQQRKRSLDDIETAATSKATSAEKKKIQGLRALREKVLEREKLIHDTEHQVLHAEEELRQRQGDLQDCTYRLIWACISNRNDLQIEAIKKGYHNGLKEMGEEHSDAALNVHCVSAYAHGLLHIGDQDTALSKGFSSQEETGIPALKEALITRTWSDREKIASDFISDVENCISRITMWSADADSNAQMAKEQREQLNTRIASILEDLDQKFSTLSAKIDSSIQLSMVNGIIPRLSSMADEAAQAAEKKVRSWPQMPTRWNTFRAINRLRGTMRGSRGKKTYNWNEDLNLCFDILKDWRRTFANFESQQPVYDKTVQECIEQFVETLINLGDDMPAFIHDGLFMLKETLLRYVIILKNNGTASLKKLNNTGKDIHRNIKETIVKEWTLIYLECGQAQGIGHFKKSQELHRQHIEGKGGPQMYHTIAANIEQSLRTATAKVPYKLQKGYKEVNSQIREDLNLMLERLSSQETTAELKRRAVIRAELRASIAPNLAVLENAVCAGFKPEEQPHEDPEAINTDTRIADDLFDEDPDLAALLSIYDDKN